MAARTRQILDLETSLVAALPGECGSCCFWESGGACAPGACPATGVKESWVAGSLEEGFCPGKLVRSEGLTLGYIQFAPAEKVPRLASMPYPTPSRGAVYITCLYVVPEFRGAGLGKLLLESAERSLYRKKYRILETHGLPTGRHGPSGPAEYFKARGFRVVTSHHEAPLMRLDLRSLVAAQENIQSLLERLTLPRLGRRPVPRPDAPTRKLSV